MVRRSKEGTEFTFYGKDYKTITSKDTTKIQVHANDILTATTIYNFFTTKPQTIHGSNFEKDMFVSERPNHRPKQIVLKFTSFVGNDSIAVAGVSTELVHRTAAANIFRKQSGPCDHWWDFQFKRALCCDTIVLRTCRRQSGPHYCDKSLSSFCMQFSIIQLVKFQLVRRTWTFQKAE